MTHSDTWLTVRFFFQEFPSVLLKYLGLILCPWNLHSHRLLPHISHFWLAFLLVVIASSVWVIRRYGRYPAFCIGWYVLSFFPKTPVMIFGNFMLDHWAYPALLGVLWPLGSAVAAGWHSRRELTRSLTGMLYFAVLIIWALLVHLNVALRGTDENMYRWALRFTSSHPVKYNLGILLLDTGRPDEAAHYLESVYQYYPDNPENTRALAIAYWQAHHPRAAIEILRNFNMRYPGHSDIEHLLNGMRSRLKSAN